MAGALLWVWPPFPLFKLTHQFGFYASGFLYCTLLLLLALRVVERPGSHPRRRVRPRRRPRASGRRCRSSRSLAVVAVWTVWRAPRALRHLPVALRLAAARGAPVDRLEHRARLGLFEIPYGQFPYPHRLRLFFSPILPMTLGLRVPFSQQGLPAGFLVLPLLLLLASCSSGASGAHAATNAAVLYSIVLVFPFLYALSPLTSTRSNRGTRWSSPRARAARRAARHGLLRRSLLVLLAGCAVSFVVVDRMNTYVRTTPAAYPTAPRDLGR